MKMSSDIPVHPRLLEAVLDGFVQAACILIRAGVVPASPYDVQGITWKLEPKGTEEWCLPTETIKRGWGDCEDLALWLAAGYRADGVDPGARVRLKRTGEKRWHAVVELSDGSYEDPSDVLKPRGVRRAV